MERWFAQHSSNGDRNNQMIKYALALLDNGMTLPEIETRVKQFNASLSNGMEQSEIDATIMRTVARKFTEAA
jgi:ABC-type dipeptide/oligopeptide/nickel transport system ATPase component